MLDAVLQHLSTKLRTIRLKEIAKLALAITMFNHNTKSEKQFYSSIEDELRSVTREGEIEQYHQSFVTCIWSLAIAGRYSEDLIALALNEAMIRDTHKDISFHVAALQHSVRIEVPSYNGPFLSAQALQDLQSTRHISARVPNATMRDLSRHERTTLEVAHRLQLLCNRTVLVRHLLPHYHHPDIVFQVNGDGSGPREPELQQLHGVLMPSNGSTLAAVVVHGPGCFSHASQHLMGLAVAKVRQLRRLGFKVTEVSHLDVSNLSTASFNMLLERKLKATCSQSLMHSATRNEDITK